MFFYIDNRQAQMIKRNVMHNINKEDAIRMEEYSRMS